MIYISFHYSHFPLTYTIFEELTMKRDKAEKDEEIKDDEGDFEEYSNNDNRTTKRPKTPDTCSNVNSKLDLGPVDTSKIDGLPKHD